MNLFQSPAMWIDRQSLVSRFVALAFCVVLGACSVVELSRMQPGMSADEVRSVAGKPTETRTLKSGEAAWYYVGGFAAWRTYRLIFDDHERVRDVEQVLSAESFREKVLPRRSKREEVLQALGSPGLIVRFEGKGEEVFSYRFLVIATQMICDVHIDLASGYVKSYETYPDQAYTSPAT